MYKLYDRVYNRLSEEIPATIVGLFDPDEFFIRKDAEFFKQHSIYFNRDPQWLHKNMYWVKYDEPARINSFDLIVEHMGPSLDNAGLDAEQKQSKLWDYYENQTPKAHLTYVPQFALERIPNE